MNEKDNELKDEFIIDTVKTKKERTLELIAQGIPYAQIGDLVGLSRQRVSQIALEHGYVRRPQDVKKENWEKYWDKNKDEKIKLVVPDDL